MTASLPTTTCVKSQQSHVATPSNPISDIKSCGALSSSSPDDAAPDTKATIPQPETYRVTLFLSPEAYADLQKAQTLVRHQIPSGDLNAFVSLGLRELVQKRMARKHGLRRQEQRQEHVKKDDRQGNAATPNSDERRGGAMEDARATASAPSDLQTRRVTEGREIRRAVFLRDGGCCTFRAAHGNTCGARQMLEYDHVVPFALGGRHTVENLRLRCRAHNALGAEIVFSGGGRGSGGDRKPLFAGDEPPWLAQRVPCRTRHPTAQSHLDQIATLPAMQAIDVSPTLSSPKTRETACIDALQNFQRWSIEQPTAAALRRLEHAS